MGVERSLILCVLPGLVFQLSLLSPLIMSLSSIGSRSSTLSLYWFWLGLVDLVVFLLYTYINLLYLLVKLIHLLFILIIYSKVHLFL